MQLLDHKHTEDRWGGGTEGAGNLNDFWTVIIGDITYTFHRFDYYHSDDENYQIYKYKIDDGEWIDLGKESESGDNKVNPAVVNGMTVDM